MSDDLTQRKIAWLARTCAGRNLTLRQARRLFDSLYFADCFSLGGGNVTKAAEIADVPREYMQKQLLQPHYVRQTK